MFQTNAYIIKSLYKIKSILRCRWIFFLLLKWSLFVFYYYPALILWLVVIYKWHIILKHWTGQSILSSNGWALKIHWIVTHHSFVESYTMFLWKHHPLSSFFYFLIPKPWNSVISTVFCVRCVVKSKLACSHRGCISTYYSPDRWGHTTVSRDPK